MRIARGRAACGSCSSRASAPGDRYKFEIVARSTAALPLKADPFAPRRPRCPPRTASVVDVSTLRVGRRRRGWTAARASAPAGTSRCRSTRCTSARGAPRPRLPRARPSSWPTTSRDLGFTHVELLPVRSIRSAGSWGYQVTASSRRRRASAAPDDFRGLRRPPAQPRHRRDRSTGCRRTSRSDDWALARFDGTALYEHADPRRGEHPDWGTLVFNFGRNEVRNFLARERAHTGCEEYHVDGLRVDAVASMLYLDYSRQAGEWVPNAARRPREPRGDRVPPRAEQGRPRGRARRASRWPRSRRRGPGSARPIVRTAGSASASSGTWAGCTTPSSTSPTTPCTGSTTTTS